MGSRKEEERNERIVRGLMKLPPNRRCINCNSLGPQYVCTNFWTFVCMTCSGIHREFTHRVKSVSMSKFTSQEVEALQNGGNQRAREMYLKYWDFQRQRFPDSSNVDKIREFMRNVYVDRRYSGVKSSDKPPRDMQKPNAHEDETRRASSYHSYSQSPPYDYQYEDRRYGKQAAILTRKPGSDKGYYEVKMSSYMYSPGRFSDHACEDNLANDGSNARVSGYSDILSPNSCKDNGFNSPANQASTFGSSEDVWFQSRNTSFQSNGNKDAEIPQPQRTASSGSFGSIDNNSLSFTSHTSGALVNFFSEPEQASGTLQDKAQASSEARPVDLFQQAPSLPVLPTSMNHQSQTPQLSTPDFFADIPRLHSAANVVEKVPQLSASVQKNEGWATFDTFQPSSIAHKEKPARVDTSDVSVEEKFDLFSSLDANTQWFSFEPPGTGKVPFVRSTWQDGSNKNQTPVLKTDTQPWNAFEDSSGQLLPYAITQGLNVHNHSSAGDQYFRSSEDGNNDRSQSVGSNNRFPHSDVPSHVSRSSYSSELPLMGEIQTHPVNQKSTNPFDIPFDSDSEQSNVFLDMNSLHATLPNINLPFIFDDDVPQQWFSQNQVTPYLPSAGQGGLTYMAAHLPSSQIQNIQKQEPVSSVGGNPFA